MHCTSTADDAIHGIRMKLLRFAVACLLSTVFDFSDPISVNACIDAMEELARAGVRPDGMLWDEPGFICMHGSLPVSPRLERAYKRKTGHTLREDVWKLAFDSREPAAVVEEAMLLDLVARHEFIERP